MTDQTKEVVGLAVSRATESQTGDSTFQVTFGVVAEVDDKLRQSLPQILGTMPPRQMGFNSLVLFYPFQDEVPYKVGGRWILAIEGDGTLRLSPSQVARP